MNKQSKNLLKKHQKIFPGLLLVHVNSIHISPLLGRLQFCLTHRMTVRVFNQNGLTECRAVVDAGAAVSVTTGTDFKVEGAIHLE